MKDALLTRYPQRMKLPRVALLRLSAIPLALNMSSGAPTFPVSAVACVAIARPTSTRRACMAG
jgi:hypothetical protein